MRTFIAATLLIAGATALAAAPVPDGSFEAGPAPASSWTEFSNRNNCPTGIGDWSVDFGAPAPHGVNSLWTGGTCDDALTPGPIANNATQFVTVPADEPYVSFWYLAYRDAGIEEAQPAGSDVAFVAFEGEDVWTIDVSGFATTTWNTAHDTLCYRNVMVSLAEYAGTSGSLRIGMRTDFTGPANVVFDDFVFAARLHADNFECGDFSGWSSVSQ